MVYGNQDGVEFYLGRTDSNPNTFFDWGNISLAIADADIIVDQINSSAAAATKTLASNMIAADIILNRHQIGITGGLESIGGTNGEPAMKVNMREIPSKRVMQVLRIGVGYRLDANI